MSDNGSERVEYGAVLHVGIIVRESREYPRHRDLPALRQTIRVLATRLDDRGQPRLALGQVFGPETRLEGLLVEPPGGLEGVLAAEGLLSSTRDARRVCIVGGGVVGHALALELSSQGSRVLVIERDPITLAKEIANKVHQDLEHEPSISEFLGGYYEKQNELRSTGEEGEG